MAMKLIKANVSKNSQMVEEVITDLINIRWGFQKAIDIQSGIVSVEEVMQEQAEREKSANTSVPPVVTTNSQEPVKIEDNENAG